MKQNTVIVLQDYMDERASAEQLAKEKLLRGDQLFYAAKLLEQEEFAILNLHDIKGYSLDEIRKLTGLPLATIEAQLQDLRSQFARHIEVEARRWRRQLEVLEGMKK
jgi:DNA-directed RNA polymerase specialized sigma24 family protein